MRSPKLYRRACSFYSRPARALADAPAPIPYSTIHVLETGDSDAVIAEKAAKVLPRPNQTAWMRLERTFFLHFGVNTFNEVEWGTGREEPSIFNPAALDANQWLDSVTNFGGKMIVLVCKHHDGFAIGPLGTRRTQWPPSAAAKFGVPRREQEAHRQTLLNKTEADVWPQIAPLLDAAMAELSETDHHAIRAAIL